MRRYITTKLFGTLNGIIWMPAISCNKEINVNLTRERQRLLPSRAGSLRYMVEQICNDGDFRHAELTSDSWIEVTCERVKHDRIVRTTRNFPITKFASIQDLVTEAL